jgi:hypothetical protein
MGFSVVLLDLLKLGDIFIDCSKVEANASKHKALYRHPAYDVRESSRGYANKLEAHQTIAQAKPEIERRARERYERERGE